jgi:hypothetical protein
MHTSRTWNGRDGVIIIDTEALEVVENIYL